jgi:hypothetical protein
MRDVLDGLEELALETSLRSGPSGCQILSINPPSAGDKPSAAPQSADVLDFNRFKKAAGT